MRPIKAVKLRIIWLILSVLALYQAAFAAPSVFLIDAGHGGEDGGATANGVTEKDINLGIALRLGAMLELFGVPVEYTRTEDVSLHEAGIGTIHARKSSDLRARLKMANDLEDGIYVAIHQNTYPSARERGAQIFYSPNHSLSEPLAKNVKRSILTNVEYNNTNKRGIKRAANIYIMDKLEIPGVIIECGFITNPEEARLLTEADYQNQLAASIMDACLNFMAEDVK